MVKIIMVSVLLFLAGCAVEILPGHGTDDEYNKYGTLVNSFSIDSILKVKRASSPSAIPLEEINYQQLQMINEKSDSTWVILSAPWCPDCALELEENAKKTQELHEQGINVVFIYTNYDVKNIQKQLFKAGIESRAYILSDRDYSSNESDKIVKFGKQILADSPQFSKLMVPAAVPQNFFFSSGKLTMYKTGGRIDADSVKYYFK